MSDAAIICLVIGALAMLGGSLLFWKDQRTAVNSIKIAGVEVSLSAPSLVIFVVGAGIVIFPFTKFFVKQDDLEQADSGPPTIVGVDPSPLAPKVVPKEPNIFPPGNWTVMLLHCGSPENGTADLVEMLKQQERVELFSSYDPHLSSSNWPMINEVLYYSHDGEIAAKRLAAMLVRYGYTIKPTLGSTTPAKDRYNLSLIIMESDCLQKSGH